MLSLTDEQLVERAQEGDRGALGELISRYEQRTYNLAYRLMGNHADACDAAQEALVRICVRLQNFRGDSQFSTWLYRVVTNTCLDELRRRGRNRCTSLDEALPLDEGSVPRQAADDAEGPVEYVERHEVQAAVHRAISRLPYDYRVVVILRDLHNLSYQEIAAVLGTTLGTIKSRLHRARQALRGIIEDTEAHRLDIA